MQNKIVNLSNKSKESIIEIFSNIPEGTMSLDLSGNDLGLCDEAILRQIFAKLPKSVNTLNLSNNHFGKSWASFDICRAIVKALPATIDFLDLSENNLDLGGDNINAFPPYDELVALSKLLPGAVINFGDQRRRPIDEQAILNEVSTLALATQPLNKILGKDLGNIVRSYLPSDEAKGIIQNESEMDDNVNNLRQSASIETNRYSCFYAAKVAVAAGSICLGLGYIAAQL